MTQLRVRSLAFRGRQLAVMSWCFELLAARLGLSDCDVRDPVRSQVGAQKKLIHRRKNSRFHACRYSLIRDQGATRVARL